jgi:multidrug efflux pump subunit AcrA (membrane-fusion protein)
MTAFVKYGLPIVSAGLFVLALVHVCTRRESNEIMAPPIDPPRPAFAKAIAAAGIVEPSTENIDVASPVSGVVAEVCVATGQHVEAGDPLFQLDDRHLRAELQASHADFEAAKAKLALAQSHPRPEELPIAEARVQGAEAHLRNCEDNARRVELLVGGSAVSERDVANCRETAQIALAELEQARAELRLLQAGESQASLNVSRAAVAQAQALVRRVEAELDRLIVRAPAEGTILKVNIHAGEFVSTPPDRPAMILGDTRRLHVRVDIDELEIVRFCPGASAVATPRGRVNVACPLYFVRVEPYVIPKRAVSGYQDQVVDTRVLQVIYAVEKQASDGLYVGQQVDVFIEDTEQEGGRLASTSGKKHRD